MPTEVPGQYIKLTHHPTNLPAKTADATYPAYLAVFNSRRDHAYTYSVPHLKLPNPKNLVFCL